MKRSCPINIQHPTSDSAIFHFFYNWQGSVVGGRYTKHWWHDTVPTEKHTVYHIVTQSDTYTTPIFRNSQQFHHQLNQRTGGTLYCTRYSAISLHLSMLFFQQNSKKTNLNIIQQVLLGVFAWLYMFWYFSSSFIILETQLGIAASWSLIRRGGRCQ